MSSIEKHLQKSQKGGGLGNVLASSQNKFQVVKSVASEAPVFKRKRKSKRKNKKPQIGGRKVIKKRKRKRRSHKKIITHKRKHIKGKRTTKKLRRLYATRHAVF